MRRVLSCVVVWGAVVGAACGGGRTSSRPVIASVPGPAPVASAPLAGATAIAPPGGLRRALAAMPLDSEIVFAVDFTKLRASRLYRSYEPMLRGAIGDDLNDFRDVCGFDLLQTMSGVLIGGRGEDLEQATMFVNGLDRTAAMGCVDRHLAARKASGEVARLMVDGDYVEFQDEPDPDGATRLLWVDDRSALLIKDGEVAASAPALRAAAAARDGDGLTRSSAFMALLGRTRTDAAVWFAARGDAPMLSALVTLKPRAVLGAFDVGAGVVGELRMWMGNPEDARARAAELDAQLDAVRSSPFGSIVSDVAIVAQGEDLVIAIVLSADQLAEIMKLATQFGGP